MSPGNVVRVLAASFLLLACDCGGAGDFLPSALAAYPRDQYEVTPTDDWSSPGLRFYRVSLTGVDDLSSTSVVAVDERGTLVEGADLFARFTSLPPDALAARACYTLIDGCSPLAEADPDAALWLAGDPSGVHAPHRDADHLVFDTIEGEMHPRVVRVTVEVTTGSILSRDPLPVPAATTTTVPGSISVTVGIEAGRFVTATLESAVPAHVTGCVSSVAGTCSATIEVPLDADAVAELPQRVADVRAIPRCEPEAIAPGDVDYHLSWLGAPREYVGHVPGDEANVTARGSGPCRADARLAWWIARWVLAQSRPASEMPSPIVVTLDATRSSGPTFVNATLHLERTPAVIEGCTAAVGGSCRATHQVELDAARTARARVLVEDLRAEPCHVPFPAGVALSIPMGLAYDGRCGADPALAWWVAGVLDPSAMGAPTP